MKKVQSTTVESTSTVYEEKKKSMNDEDVLFALLRTYPISRTDENQIYFRVKRNGKFVNLEKNSSALMMYLKSRVKEIAGRFPSERTVKNCLDFMDDASADQKVEPMRYRVASVSDSIVYDLQDGNCVVINSAGWKIVKNDFPIFLKAGDELPQVTPLYVEDGYNKLDQYLNISPDDRLLLKIYLVACLNPEMTVPCLSVNGTNGSGKSTLSRIVKKIVDPSANELETLPASEDDIRVRLSYGHYLVFDNLSTVNQKQSNFLCGVVTGTSTSGRVKFSNNGITTTKLHCGMCFNGITPFFKRADMAERTLFLTTKLIQGKKRLTDKSIWENFSKDLPEILGGLFSLYSKTMKLLGTVDVENKERLADFHEFGYTVAEAMGGLGAEFNRIMAQNKARQMEVTCENSTNILLVCDFLKECDGEWKGTMSLLYKDLKNHMQIENSDDEFKYNASIFPKAPNYLSNMLRQYESAFASKGVRFEIKKNGDGYSEIHFTTDWVIRKPIIGIKRTPILSENA